MSWVPESTAEGGVPAPALTFTVYGIPAPKGSKSGFPVRRKNGSIGVAIVEGKTDRQKDWAHRVEEVVQHVADGSLRTSLLDEPLIASAVFYLPKPKSAPKLKRTYPDRKPDVDKLLRAVLDPMTGVLIADDARIIAVSAAKRYAEDSIDQRPRVDVAVWTVSDEDR